MNVKHLLKQTISLYTTSSINEYGEETWTTGTSTPARVELKSMTVKTPEGEEVLADGVVYFDPVDAFTVGDKLRYDGVNYRALTVSEGGVDGQGNAIYTKAIIQRWAA